MCCFSVSGTKSTMSDPEINCILFSLDNVTKISYDESKQKMNICKLH